MKDKTKMTAKDQAAFQKFQDALKHIVSVPKSNLPKKTAKKS